MIAKAPRCNVGKGGDDGADRSPPAFTGSIIGTLINARMSKILRIPLVVLNKSLSLSESEGELQYQFIKRAKSTARRAFVLCLEIYEVTQIITESNGGAVSTTDSAIDRIIARHVHILITEKRSQVVKSSRELRVKARNIKNSPRLRLMKNDCFV